MTYANDERWHRGPLVSYEEIEIRASDGTTLRAEVEEPGELRATAVLAHTIPGRRSAFGRRDAPGLAQALAERGFRTIAFDFRGERYDDLVRTDLPAVVAAARARADGKPVVVVGHALGGHVALGAQGSGRIDVDGIVAIGVCHPSARSRLVRRAAGRTLEIAASRFAWARMLAAVDLEALSSVRVPVAAVVAKRDRLLCPPHAAEALARRCAGPVSIFRANVGPSELLRDRAAVDAALAILRAAVNR
jgi:pimeloyl-ACP methyl ester carboxylesterase